LTNILFQQKKDLDVGQWISVNMCMVPVQHNDNYTPFSLM
jgi:hypothetical protein